jgi:O-antigen/teichoic acid export membrane protein
MTMDQLKSPDTRNVANAAVKATKWVFLSSLLLNSCQAIFAIILARLLVPSDFGLVAYATMFLGFVNLIQDMGMRQALIQRKDDIEASANIVFTINMVLGSLWYLVAFVVAPYLADFFNNSQITPILRVMAISFLIVPWGSVQNTLLTKQLRFNKLFFIGLVPTLIPGLFSIGLAILGHGVWSLVVGSLMGSVFNVLVIWIMVPWRPKWRFDLSLAGKILKFGGMVSIENFLSWSVNTIDDVLVGKWLGGASLGLYSLGFKIGIAPAKYISSSLIRVAFPAFSRIQENKNDLREAFLKTVKYIAVVSFPLGVGIAVTASLFVPLFFGEKWVKAVPVIQCISIYGIFMSIGSMLPQIYKALGRPDIYLKYVSVRCLVAIPVYFYVVPMGLTALSVAHLVLTMVFFPINLSIGMRILKIPFRKLMNVLRVPITGSIGIALICLLLQQFVFDAVPIPSAASLVLTVVAGATIYISSVFFTSRNTIWEINALIKRAIVK